MTDTENLSFLLSWWKLAYGCTCRVAKRAGNESRSLEYARGSELMHRVDVEEFYGSEGYGDVWLCVARGLVAVSAYSQAMLSVQNHPSLLPKQLTPPNAALTPVNMTSGPYWLPYTPALPTSPALINASLTGPQVTFPMPRPATRTANTMVVSPVCWLLFSAFMTPG